MRNFGNLDDDIFRISKQEYLKVFLTGILLSIVIAYTFFKNLFGVVVVLPIFFLYIKWSFDNLIKKKKARLEIEFKDAILAIASSLQSGYSINHAYYDALELCTRLYGSNSSSVVLFNGLIYGQKLNIPMTQLLDKMAERGCIDIIRNFSETIKITMRYGGNLPDMMQNLAVVTEDKLRVQSEIRSVTTSVRYEAYIMDIIPMFIIWYMNITEADFLSVLYGGILGRGFMCICLFVYMAAVFWQFHIIDGMTSE